MDVSYDRSSELLIDKEMRKTEFAKAVGISIDTLVKLSRNDTVPMEVIIKICRCLDCTANDTIEILPEIGVR